MARPPFSESELDRFEDEAFAADEDLAAKRITKAEHRRRVTPYRQAVKATDEYRKRAAKATPPPAKPAPPPPASKAPAARPKRAPKPPAPPPAPPPPPASPKARTKAPAKAPAAVPSPPPAPAPKSRSKAPAKAPASVAPKSRSKKPPAPPPAPPPPPASPKSRSKNGGAMRTPPEARAEARESLRRIREADKATKAVGKAAERVARADERLSNARERIKGLSGYKRRIAEERAERAYSRAETARANLEVRATAAADARAAVATRPARSEPTKPTEPNAVRKMRESLSKQGITGPKLEAAIVKYRASFEAAQANRPAPPQITVTGASGVKGVDRYSKHLEERIAAGELTRAQADKALAGFVQGQVKNAARLEAAKETERARLAAMTPKERAQLEAIERTKAHERKKVKNARDRERRKERERENKARREEAYRASAQAGGGGGGGGGGPIGAPERIQAEGSAIRSGERGGSFMGDAFAAASSLTDKFERSSLYRDGEGKLTGVKAIDMQGNTIDIPNEVVAKGPEAIADYIEERAQAGEIDYEWLELYAEGVEYDDGDVYETTA